MGLAEILQKRMTPRKDESDDETLHDTDAAANASGSSAGSSAGNTDVEGEGESGDEVRRIKFPKMYQSLHSNSQISTNMSQTAKKISI